mgnify:CR=1 FL=1
MKFILLNGRRYSGKDTVANLIEKWCKSRGLKTIFFALADECKLDFARENGLDGGRMIHDREYKEQYRLELTDYYHEQLKKDKEIYEKIVSEKIKTLVEKEKNMVEKTKVDLVDLVVIKDARTLYNLEFLSSHLAEIFRIHSTTSNSINPITIDMRISFMSDVMIISLILIMFG